MYISCEKELRSIYSIQEGLHGKSVVATRDIPPQTILMRASGELLTFEATRFLGDQEAYTVQVAVNKYILCRPPFRFVNHSCNPNAALDADLFLYSLRLIKSGEEITWDYSSSMLERSWTMNCTCGAPHCRKLITDFDLLPVEIQQRYIRNGWVMPFILRALGK